MLPIQRGQSSKVEACNAAWASRSKQVAVAGSSLGPRPFLYVDLCACAGKGEGQERKGLGGTRLSSRRILECKQFHLWSNTAYTISDNCTHVTEYGVQAAVNSKDPEEDGHDFYARSMR